MNASKNIENINSDSNVEWISRSLSMAGAAGAFIDGAIGVINVINETSPVASHFLLKGQFVGLAGASGPSQVT